MDADNDFPLMAQDHYYQHLALYGIMEQGITDNRLRLDLQTRKLREVIFPWLSVHLEFEFQFLC